MGEKLSVLIPARNEVFLSKTIDDIFAQATGDVEVIAVLDGYWPDPQIPERDNLVFIHFGEAHGMRNAINSAAAIAKGKYLLKCDAHCMFDQGFDEILTAECDGDWIVIPRRHRLDAENWCLQDVGKPPVDYHYLSCPMTERNGFEMHGAIWNARTLERPDILIDETMSFQGSCWLMSRRHWDWLGGMSEEGYGTFTQEPQEIGNKTWLGGGKIMTNKKTWYAHLHKGSKYGRMYQMSKEERDQLHTGHTYSAEYWMGNLWAGRTHDIEWLVDRFWPVPTWTENWRELWTQYALSQNVLAST